MRKYFPTFLAMGVCALLGAPTYADYGVSVKVGTPGIGVDVTRDLTETLNARVGLNMFSFSMDESSEGDEGDSGKATEISAKLSLLTVPILVDWHPWKGGFRMSGGLVINNNKIELSAVPGDTVELNDHEYEVTSLDGEASFNAVAPYLGIGWGNAGEKVSGHWHFAFDLGVMFQGEPKIDIEATAADANQKDALKTDLDEETKTLEDDAAVFDMYPVLSFGVSYTF